MAAERFDLVLLMPSFRRCCAYVALVQELSSKYRIGIIPMLSENPLAAAKLESTNALFTELCVEKGAELIQPEQEVRCGLLMIQQWNYEKNEIDDVYRRVMYDKAYWLVALPMGNSNYENLFGNPIDKVLVVDKKFYRYRLDLKPEEKSLGFVDDMLIEVGEPYLKYPIFDDVQLDYVWANPTPFSFPNIEDRLNYLETIDKLFQQINANDVIAFKPHNAVEGVDFVVKREMYRVLSKPMMRWVNPILDNLARFTAKVFKCGKVHQIAVHYSIAYMYLRLMKRAVPLSELTEYHNLNLEVFLPNVKKGLITGRSNSIWHSLFAKTPVYNCVADDVESADLNKMHSFNMHYFNVDYCGASLDFSDEHYAVVDESTRHADFVAIVANALTGIVAACAPASCVSK